MYSADLLVIFFFIFSYYQLNKRLRFSQRFFTGIYLILTFLGLTIYLPPLPQDFEILAESAKRPRTNRKGEAPKSARISRHPKLKIPLRSAKLEPGINQNVTDFMYDDFDFAFMLWCSGLLIPLCSLLIKSLFSDFEYVNQSNLSFHFSFLCLLVLCFQGFKHTYNSNSNECKLSLFVLIKTFFFSFIFFSYFSDMFSVELPIALSQSIPRLSKVLSTILETEISVKSWHLLLTLAISCCLLSFLIARAAVKCGYYFYLFLYAETEQYFKEEGSEEKKEQTSSQVRVLSIVVFLLPFAISVTYIHDIFTDPLLKINITSFQLDLFRILLVWLFCVLKIVQMRKEVQLYFNETVAYFQALVSEEVQESKFKFVQNAIRLTIHRIWLLGCQYLYTFGIPSILSSLQTYNLLWNCRPSQDTNYNFSKAEGDLTLKVKEAIAKPLFLCESQYSWLSVLTFWFHLSLAAVSAFALFYYRRYKESVAQQ